MKRIVFYGAAAILAVGLLLFMLPAIQQSRQHTGGTEHGDMRNLHTIYTACIRYSMDHDGKYPSNWSVLRHVEPQTFVTPRNRHKAGSLSNVMDWTDYIYVANVSPSSPSDAILAISPPQNYDGKGAVILRNNGAMEWIGKRQLNQIRLPEQARGHVR
jgi:hypothetical protein